MSVSWRVWAPKRVLFGGAFVATGTAFLLFASGAVAAPTWKFPQSVSQAGVGDVSLALAPNSALVLGTDEHISVTDSAALVRDRAFGGSLTTPSIVGQATTQIHGLEVAVDSKGNTIAVWARELPGPVQRVEAAYRPAGGAFRAVAVLSPTDITVDKPQVEFDAQGNAVIVWYQDDVNIGLFAQTKPTGGDFPPIASATRLTDPGSDGGYFGNQLSAGPNGDMYLIYSQDEGGNRRIYTRYRPTGGDFAPRRRADDSVVSKRLPQIAVTPSGGSIAAWVREDTNAVEASPSSAGGAYAASSRLSSAGADSTDVQLASDGAGGVDAAWLQLDGSYYEAFHSYLPPSNQFPGAGQRLSSEGPGSAAYLKVGSSNKGAAVVSWTEELDGVARRLARYRQTPSAVFGTQTLIDGGVPDSTSTTSSPIFDEQGNAFELLLSSGGNVAQLACLDAAGPQLTVDPLPAEVVAGTPAKFEQRRKDQCSSIASSTWNMGDGSAVLTTTAGVHTYGKPGTFKQTAEATDDVQNSSSIQRDVVVKPAPLNVSLVRTSKLRPTRSGSYRIRVNTSAPARFGIKATVVKRIKRRRGKRVRTVRKSVTVASGTGVATKAGVQLVGFKPNRAGKALIRRASRSGLKVSLALNADGQGIAATRRASTKGSTRLVAAKRK